MIIGNACSRCFVFLRVQFMQKNERPCVKQKRSHRVGFIYLKV